MSVQIFDRTSGDVTILDVHGRVTIGAGADALTNKFRELTESGAKKVLINLAGVAQVDSTGIASLVRMFVTMSRRGDTLKLLKPQGRVREMLELTRLLGSIPTFDDEAEAIKAFQ